MNRLYFIIVFAISYLSCAASNDDSLASQPLTNTWTVDAYSQLISKTKSYSADYTQEALHRGRIERIDYSTRNYAEGNDRERDNTAYVYLPYGYDDDVSMQYNVLYLIHGHYGTASSMFTSENELLRKVLDHLFENREAAPTIVVAPSYNYGEPIPNYVDADPYCKALPLELVNDLLPLVETNYRTHLTSGSVNQIEATRQYRAIGGFSMGAVTTWYALAETFEAFKYYLPMSGDCWSLGAFAGMNRPVETADYLSRIILQSPNATNFYIWAASGTNDSAYSETLQQVRGMAQLTDVFDINHLSFHEKDGAMHDYRALPEYVYNALPFFFPYESSTAIDKVMQETRLSSSTIAYGIDGLPAQGRGIVIQNRQKMFKK